MTKTQRQHRIGELIERERISTAAQLVTRLQSEGISATQATVTRDLQELGTIKVRDENGVRRIVAATASTFTHAPLDHLRRMMASGWCRSRAPRTSWSFEHPRAARTSWRRRLTAARSTACSAASPVTTRSS